MIASMTPLRYILASLRHHWRIHAAVGLGVAVATAVLTGALLVGDSVRGSLRDLTLQRLGRIDEALVAGPMFRAALVDELAASNNLPAEITAVEPVILISGTLQFGSGSEVRRATRISVIGCRESFWALGAGGPAKPLADDEIALTESLAGELGVAVGDTVLLRVPSLSALPTDSFLGNTNDTSRARRFRLAAILPPTGLARFGLVPNQHLPRNVFVHLTALQRLLEKPGQANAILAAGAEFASAPDEAASRALQASLRPKLEDYGIRLERVESPLPYYRISSNQLVLRDEIVAACQTALSDLAYQPVVTYLANTLEAGEGASHRQVPYSTITGVDSSAQLGPLLDEMGRPIALASDEIALNRWAADELRVSPGDRITVTSYEPESTHGRLAEHDPPSVFKLKAVVDLIDPAGKPTPAADPKLTPEVAGVTDQASIDDWDVPFELVEPRRPQDDAYWDEYRTTPKAFVALATASRIWGSRWGTISLIRIPSSSSAIEADQTGADLTNRLEREIDPAALGMTFQPIKRQGLAAASGTTPFDGLFLAFSFFLIAAAIMLVSLLFQLGVAGRTKELGVLAAVGVGRVHTARLLVGEGLVVSVLGAAAGIIGGVLYAWLMVTGLRTWWVAAVSTPFLELHATPRSLAIGWLVGVVVAWLTIWWSIRRLVRQPAGRLLSGATGAEMRPPNGRRAGRTAWSWVRIVLVALIAALCILGFTLRDESQAAIFFGSGGAVLVLLLGEVCYRLGAARGAQPHRHGLSLPLLSALNTARHPGRSALNIGLVASASFVIVAMSAFRLETGDEGTGGFSLLATSDQNIVDDLNTPGGRSKVGGFTEADDAALRDWRIHSLRMRSGEDASCLNLYKPSQPTVLGVPAGLIERGWNSVTPLQPLRLDLGRDEQGQPIIPVIVDANTAKYSLFIGVGDRFSVPDAADRDWTLQVVGLLKNSVLQGKLLVSEANFLQLYPDADGYRFFLIEQAANEVAGPAHGPAAATARGPALAELQRLLESRLADDGFDAIDAHDQLAEYLAVQNTYLSTFQSLGGLGLLLGTIGLAVVQLRSVLERRGELAVMRAQGFHRRRLVWMVVSENAVLLLGGLAVGCLAAAVALIPQWSPQAAGVPWRTLAALLGSIALVGVVAGWLATRATLRAPIVPALRGD
jgi:ABC-type antimicrobial peptide transport system permease subunit